MVEEQSTADRRQSLRAGWDSPVEIVLEGRTIPGSGRNLSRTGVLALVEGGIHVRVNIEGSERPGTVVRLQAMDEKSWSLAVKFDEPLVE